MSNLIVGGPGHQWIVNELNRVDLQHVEDDLGVLRIVLIPAVVQASCICARPTEDTSFNSNPACPRWCAKTR